MAPIMLEQLVRTSVPAEAEAAWARGEPRAGRQGVRTACAQASALLLSISRAGRAGLLAPAGSARMLDSSA